MDLATILPMAIVMIAGPQILSAIFLATSDGWRRNSTAYVVGAATSMTAVVLAAYFFSSGARELGASNDSVYVAVLVMLVGAAIQTFRNRKEARPPKWMGTLQTANPGFSFKLGFLLLGVFPTDFLSSAAVGSYLSTEGSPWWYALPFVALTISFLAAPLILLLVFGDRAEAALPKVRNWMTENSWVVSELVIVLFIALTASNLAG